MAAKQSIQFYPSAKCSKENFKCLLVAELSGVSVEINTSDNLKSVIPYYPAMSHGSVIVFGSNAVCKYLAKDVPSLECNSLSSNNLLDIEEFKLASVSITPEEEKTVLTSLEATKPFEQHVFASYVLYNAFTNCANMTQYPYLHSVMGRVSSSAEFKKATEKLDAFNAAQAASAAAAATAAPSGKKDKAAKKAEKGAKNDAAGASAAPSAPVNYDDIVKPVLGDVDWASTGLISSLRLIFSAAILAAFPQSKDLQMDTAAVMRCANPAHGDFQCNNAMALSKSLKGLAGYSGPVSPKDIAERIIYAIPDNSIISGTSAAPNGFINIKLSTTTLVNSIASITVSGAKPPSLPHRKVLVDFSSPNIAKEMHVGHLRSTIIGDSICRILEFCQFEVLRINHVGDWGTQFGMLITYLQEAYPDILTNPPNISDLTAIYKESKKRFDADEQFKETSRLNVVRLQGGDPACRAIWTLLCNISRKEFQVVYDCLGVNLVEVGESFYNEMIPGAIEELQKVNLVEDEQGMLIIKLPHFTIPLIVRKSDGGYGYDSTDMAALKYRLHTLNCDWLVYITDAGQQPHFHMCFDAAKAAGWVGDKRVEHIGFGVVCGDDGKRFKTRSSETVRLIDLLNAAKDRMKESLQARADEGKTSISGEELEEASKIIGYGAVKYFDLKQHPSTNYIFSYDRMLDTKGDTAVYLLFAYARLASILRKAKEEKNIDISAHTANAHNVLVLDNPAERALAFELLQLGDVLKSVIQELLPNRLCDYLKELAVKFTEFVTKCHVLNAESEAVTISRLLLCEASKRVMAQCFSLLGINTLDRI